MQDPRQSRKELAMTRTGRTLLSLFNDTDSNGGGGIAVRLAAGDASGRELG